jgi:hypothetical protein
MDMEDRDGHVLRGIISHQDSWRPLGQDPLEARSQAGMPAQPITLQPLSRTAVSSSRDESERLWAFVGPEEAEHRIGFLIQAYADDVIFISRTVPGMKRILIKIEEFARWSKMEVNVKKCATASYLIDINRHRYCLAENLELNGAPIDNLILAESLKYLGTIVAARRTVRL